MKPACSFLDPKKKEPAMASGFLSLWFISACFYKQAFHIWEALKPVKGIERVLAIGHFFGGHQIDLAVVEESLDRSKVQQVFISVRPLLMLGDFKGFMVEAAPYARSFVNKQGFNPVVQHVGNDLFYHEGFVVGIDIFLNFL